MTEIYLLITAHKPNQCFATREVSNFGNIRDTTHRGKIIIKHGANCNGYRRINISGIQHAIHRLVYQYHVGEIPVGFEIDHIDNNRSNNRLDNIQLITPIKNLEKKIYNKRKTGSCTTINDGRRKKYQFSYLIKKIKCSNYFYTEGEQLALQRAYIKYVEDGVIS
tara:strand:- start:3490 stop:3984 length:495 start_codon:yes stop_codon:yes gene_type:complete